MSDDVDAGGPSSAVRVEFLLTREEALPIFRWQIRRALFNRWTTIGIVLLAIGGTILLVVAPSPVGGAIVLGAALFEFFMLSAMVMFVPARAWRKKEDTGPTTLLFSEDGVGVQTKNTSAQHRWAMFSMTLERDGMYLLRIGKRSAYQVVPRRSFANALDEDVFRSLVTRHTEASLAVRT